MSRPEFFMSNRDMPWRRIKPLAYESLLNWIDQQPAEAQVVGLRVAERHEPILQHAIDTAFIHTFLAQAPPQEEKSQKDEG